MKPLSKAMLELVAYIGEGTLYRHAGGFWTRNADWQVYAKTYGTSSVEALVSRGVAVYTQWKDGKNGRFPVQLKLAPRPSTPPDESLCLLLGTDADGSEVQAPRCNEWPACVCGGQLTVHITRVAADEAYREFDRLRRVGTTEEYEAAQRVLDDVRARLAELEREQG